MDDTMKNESLVDRQGWDEYWQGKNLGGSIYAFVAHILRKFFFRPTLNHFLRKNFAPGSKLLHAGCGSGECDTDVRHDFKITGLDLSPEALNVYRKNNGDHCDTLHSDLLNMNLPDASMDGVYNLGVFEHFLEPDIDKILQECRRVLKPQGRLVALWPPEYGVTVNFFKVAVKLTKMVTGKDVKFHPDEPSRIPSKKWAKDVFERNGFEVKEYYFGPRDLFTYATVVAQAKPI